MPNRTPPERPVPPINARPPKPKRDADPIDPRSLLASGGHGFAQVVVGQARLVEDPNARTVPDGMAVRDARQVVRSLAEEPGGCLCPVCGGRATVYDRKLGRGPVLCLLWLYQATKRGETGPIDVQANAPASVLKAREFDKLALFGLADQDDAGRWFLTPEGRDFAEGKTRVPAFVQVFQGETVGQASTYASLDTLAESSPAVAFHVAQFRAGLPVGAQSLPK